MVLEKTLGKALGFGKRSVPKGLGKTGQERQLTLEKVTAKWSWERLWISLHMSWKRHAYSSAKRYGLHL